MSSNPDGTNLPDDGSHYFRDDSDRWMPKWGSMDDEKTLPGPVPSHQQALATAAVHLPPEYRKKLLSTIMLHHVSPNMYYDGGYDLPELPDLASNSYSSLSLNSPGTFACDFL